MKRLCTFCFCLLLCLSITGCGIVSSSNSFLLLQKSLTEHGTVVRHIDTHGGFHGDGIEYTCITYDEAAASTVESSIKADPRFSPISTDDALLSSCDNAVAYEKEIPLPSSVRSSGWYAYVDRSPADSEHVLNFTLILYIAPTHTLHIWRADA